MVRFLHGVPSFTWAVRSTDRMARYERADNGSIPLRPPKFMPTKNPEVWRNNGREHYRRNKQYYKDKAIVRKNRLYRDVVLKYKDKPCTDCGNSFPLVCMDYDHVRGEKRFNISQAYNQVSLRMLTEEISKCDVVCSNCHRIRTANRILALSSNGQDISLRN